MSFGKKLKMLRFTNQLDQNAMSKRLNVSQPVYSRYENDEKQVNEKDEFVKRVTEEFTVTGKWLLDETSSNTLIETGGITNTANSNGPIENYYSLPKDFMDAYF